MKRDWAGYAERYGVSERTCKRWAAHGDDKNDPCPLDQPEEMRGWWARTMSQRCPAKLLGAAVKGRLDEPKREYPPAPEMELPVQPVILKELQAVEVGEVGIEATLKRLQEAEVHTHREYQDALKAGDEGKAKLAQKMFLDLAKQVAIAEEKAVAQRVRVRDLIPRLEAEVAIADFHQAFHGLLRGGADRFFRAFGVEVSAGNDEKWQVMMDGICETLQGEVFGEGSE